MARKKNTNGKMNAGDIRSALNKKFGKLIAHDLGENPSDVKDWIPTGSRWLDSILGNKLVGGIPVGRITEIAGLEGTGKSYMAAQVAKNALEKGLQVAYFDSEAAISSDFWDSMGIDRNQDIQYLTPDHIEEMFEVVEFLLTQCSDEKKWLFILDSLAMIPCNSDIESDFDPTSSVAVKARITSKAMQKLIQPLSQTNSTFLVLNQLKTNIGHGKNPKYLSMKDKYNTPGGKTMNYSYSTRVWLEGRQAKDSYIYDERGFRIGSEVKATILKSRFGGEGRQCAFKILWSGDSISIQDEESWLDAVKKSPHLKQAGAWYTLVFQDGKEKKFQGKQWADLVKNDPDFRGRVIQMMDEEVISKFQAKEGQASDFYNVE
jgi:recombination protein RecA